MTVTSRDVKCFFDAIDKGKTICIASHLNPDGDNLGSLCGMFHLLKKMGKEVIWYGEDEVPGDFLFLPAIEERCIPQNEDFDLFIALDCADEHRMGHGLDLFSRARTTVNIDHHKTNTHYAQINLVDPVSSTGELLYEIVKDRGLLDRKIATALFTAISSDTGSFKYDSVTPRTFAIASQLMEFEIPINQIAVNLYQKRSLPKTDLLIRTFQRRIFFEENRIGVVTVLLDDIDAVGAKSSDTEGIVEFLRDTEPVEIAVLLKERKNGVKISIRTKSYTDAVNIVKPMGGGGHTRAAGATYHGTLEKCFEIVKELAAKELKRAGNTCC